MKKNLKKQGFTLVELIIVIAIIAVLAVAAFMMLTKWLGKSRDSRRLGDLGTIARGLTVGYSDADDGINMYPDIMHQDDKIGLMSGDEIVGYQGTVDTEVVKGASMQKVPLDPSDQNEYTYLVTQNRQKFQVLGMLEDGTEVGVLNDVFALDYKNRVPVTKGFDLGVILEKGTNLPIQYVEGLSFTGIDLMVGTERDDFKAIVNDTEVASGTDMAELPIVKEDLVEVPEGTVSQEVEWKEVLSIHSDDVITSSIVSDNFDDGLNSEWIIIDDYGLVTSHEEKARIFLDGNGNNHTMMKQEVLLKGDFDIQLEWTGTVLPHPSGDDIPDNALNQFIFNLIDTEGNSNFVRLEDYKNHGRHNLAFRTMGTAGNSGWDYTSDNAGKFRIVRNDDTLSFYAGPTGTNLLASVDGASGNISEIKIYASSYYGAIDDLTVDIDNFQLTADEIYSLDINDSSESNNVVELKGDVHHSTSAKKVGDTSIYFDGDGDYLEIADSDDFDFGTGDFTIETWVNLESLSNNQMFLTQRNGTDDNRVQFGFHNTVGLIVLFQNNGNQLSFYQNSLDGWEAGKWYHVAVVRSGDTWKLFKDGKEVKSATNSSYIMPNVSAPLLVGKRDDNQFIFKGYMDEIRIRKGGAVRTEDFSDDLPTSGY